ncbi:MAG: D-tyrosyl-tRNA(Tyr) deacylase [Rhodocyclaceae bacterium]|jgi:D-tyrosyl-tRNA(Tyr) deacylase|nr:D-tyrosyl-tRNA(Tyr) deacylase [Rhodocyclaceae bacterium]
MRAVVQRVTQASVTVAGRVTGSIGPGLLVLAGFENEDTQADIDWMARKLAALRIFPDERGVMNRDIVEVGGEILAVSQFTLYAAVKKGNRPSWCRAASADFSAPMFQRFVMALEAVLGRPVPTGVFGAEMQVSLVNDGPVTLAIDSKSPE